MRATVSSKNLYLWFDKDKQATEKTCNFEPVLLKSMQILPSIRIN